MNSRKEINIELVKGSINDYRIKDKNKIVIGIFSIINMDKSNKRCDIRFKFYRNDNYYLVRETLEVILKVVFKEENIFKVNIMVDEAINLNAFLDIGFTLEGILTDNIFIKGSFYDELSFGINKNEHINNIRNNIIEIKGLRVTVRNFTPDDADKLLDYYEKNKNHLQQFEPQRDQNFYTYEAQRNILLESYKQLMNGSSCDMGIYIKDKLIGKIKISSIVYGVFKSGILGYSIDKEYEGKGYMKETIKLVLKYAKEYLELHRIEASALVNNEKYKGVLLSCGFEEVGITNKYLFINGKWIDHITYYKIL